MELERIDRDDPRRPPTPIEDDTPTVADDDFAHDFYRPYTPHRNGRPDIFLANGEMPTASQAQASRRAAQAQAGQRTPATGLSSRNGLRSASTPVATPGSTRPSTTTPSSNRSASGGVKALAARFEQQANTKATPSGTRHARTRGLPVTTSRTPNSSQSVSSSFPPSRSDRTNFAKPNSREPRRNGQSSSGSPLRSRSRQAASKEAGDSLGEQLGADSGRHPLFGEVIAGQDTGYGIPLFASESEGFDDQQPMMPRARTHSDMDSSKIDSAYDPSFSRPSSSTGYSHSQKDFNNLTSLDTHDLPIASRKQSPTSRIPVYTRRTRSPSDASSNTPYTRHGSAMDEYRFRNNGQVVASKTSREKENNGFSRPVTPPNLLSSRRYDPKSGGSTQRLKAQIVTPLPKVSPPLRSSRPRLPVSSAAGHATRGGTLDLPSTNTDETSSLGHYDFDMDTIANRTDQLQQALSEEDEYHTGGVEEQEAHYHPGLPELSLNTGTAHKADSFGEDTDIEYDESPVLGMADNTPSVRTQLLPSDDEMDYSRDSAQAATGAEHYEMHEDEEETSHAEGRIHFRDSFVSQDGRLSLGHLVAGLRDRRGSSTSRTSFNDSPDEMGDEASIHIGLGATPRPLAHAWDDMDDDENNPQQDLPSPIVESLAERERERLFDEQQRFRFPSSRPRSISEDTVFDANDENSPSPSEANCSIAPNDSVSMVGQPQMQQTSPGMAFMQRERPLTMASDARSVVNRILEEYHQGCVTPEMAYGFQRQVEAVTPHMSRHTEWQSIEETEVYLNNLLDTFNYEHQQHQGFSTPIQESAEWSVPPMPGSIADLTRSPSPAPEGHGTAIIYSAPTRYTDFDSLEPGFAERRTQHMHTGSTSTVRPLHSRTNSDMTASRPPTPPQKDVRKVVVVNPAQLNAQSPLDLLATRLSSEARYSELSNSGDSLGLAIQVNSGIRNRVATPPVPSYTPPLPPGGMPLNEVLLSAAVGQPQQGQPPSRDEGQQALDIPSDGSATSSRVSSVGSMTEIVELSPSTKPEDPQKAEKDFKLRCHTIDELVTTENTFQLDMTIFEDIYKATSYNLTNMQDILTSEDRTLIFRNSRDVMNFGKKFHMALKKAAGNLYRMNEKLASKRESDSTQESVMTAQSDQSAPDWEQIKFEADRQTTIGKAFLDYIDDMGKVFGLFLMHQDAAQRRAAQVIKDPKVVSWMEECRKTSQDLTNAWNLDSFILKPFQRLCKYPLLLKQLLGATPKDHPDHHNLQKALDGVQDIIKRVDEEKKRTDTLKEILTTKKRKDSVDRTGFKKVIPWNTRNIDKLKEQQKVTAKVKAEDPEYENVAQKFGGHFFQLQIVIRDVEKYIESLKDLMAQYMRFTEAMQDFIQGPTMEDWTTMQSAAYHHIRTVKEINKKMLPQHIKQVKEKVIQPIVTCWELHQTTQRAMAKRKKRLPFYAKWKEMVMGNPKGPVDKHIEAMAMEYRLVNDSLKKELPILYSLCKRLVEACLQNLVELQMLWTRHWERVMEPVYGVEQHSASLSMDIAETANRFLHAQKEMDYRVTTMAIVNGTALAEITNFMSPLQEHLDNKVFEHAQNRSNVNLAERSPSFPSGRAGRDAYFSPEPRRQSNPHPSPLAAVFSPLDISSHGSPRSRARSGSTQQPITPRSPSSQFWIKAGPHNATPSRPATSSGRQHSAPGSASGAPRLSLDLPSSPDHPQPGLLTPDRPVLQRGASNPFSSAMPMPDSPTDGATPEPEENPSDRPVMFLAASLFEFNIDNSHTEGGLPYLRYVPGEIFDVIGLKGELWLARNQDDPSGLVGWIWEKHFARILPDTL